MTSHHLRQLRDLLRFSVVSEDGPLGRLTGLVLDPADWKIRHAVVADEGADGESVMVPVRFFRSIADKRGELHFDIAGEVLLSPGGLRGGGLAQPPLVDAMNVLGRKVAGCDEAAGLIEDLIVNIDSWQLRYLVIQTVTGRVLTDVEWCASFGGEGPGVSLDLPAAAVTAAPPYHGLDELSIGDEEVLYRHYTSRKYATEANAAQVSRTRAGRPR